MKVIKPKLHDLVESGASRTVAVLRTMGVEPEERQVSIGVTLPTVDDSPRRLVAEALIDMLLRLDPLVGAVVIDEPGFDSGPFLDDLAARVPLEHESRRSVPDYWVSIGSMSSSSDLIVDGGGWLAAIGDQIDGRADKNPVGPLAAACFAAAEVFKWAFHECWPQSADARQLEPWRGVFSLYSYNLDRLSPAISTVPIDASLVGCGGVGAGFVRTIAALGPQVSGSLNLIDEDDLTTHNLNRVSYGTVAGALTHSRKVDEAAAFLRARCPNLMVSPYPITFDSYKRRTPRRQDRVYDVIVTGLDGDEARWEVQRDIPRILIDGATGRDLNARVERVEFGQYGCLGCTRQMSSVRANGEVNCDDPPDPMAPSLSFLSAFPGILAAGELIKEVMRSGQLRGRFDHVFRYGPNPDMRATDATRVDCRAGCQRASKLAQYRAKYPGN